MDAIEFFLTGQIWWRLTGREVVSPPLPALREWSVVSPLAETSAERPPRHGYLIPFSDGTYLFSTDRLVLATSLCDAGATDEQNLVAALLTFLNGLRVVCRQPELPRSFVGRTVRSQVAGFDAPTELPTLGTNSTVRKYIAESATRWEALADASIRVTTGSIPIHGELVNDAAEAIIRSNFRSSIIFSAMAVESCAGTILDREYDRIRSETPRSQIHRFLTIQVNQNESVTRDPVFIALRGGGGNGGSRFLSLLHECPLYLLGRSLQVQHQATYSKANSLYRTRNSLAHTGTTDIAKGGLLPVSHDGAMTALETANAVLDWFGEMGTCVPNVEMIEASARAVK